MITADAIALADQLAVTGGTFDPVPWIVGGLVAIGLGAFAMIGLGRRRRASEARELEAERAARADARAAAREADGDLER